MGYTKFQSACVNFLQKMEGSAYSTATSTQVLNEVVFKLILAEITKKYKLRQKTTREG